MSDSMRFIARLESELRALTLEWERFFAGDRRVPPQRERDQLRRTIRAAIERKQPRGAAWFRLEQLQHRFAAYDELWRRQLRQREEGWAGGRTASVDRTVVTRSSTPNDRPRADVNDDDGGSLYAKWCAAQERHGEAGKLTQEQFETKLERQRQRAEQHLGRPVRLDVVVRDGRVRLGARPEKPKSEE